MRKTANEMNNLKNERFIEKSNRQIIEAERTKKKRKYHRREGVKQLFRNPIKMLYILFFAILFIVTNCALQGFFNNYVFADSELLPYVPHMSYIATIPLFSAILVCYLLPWIGKPKLGNGMKADEIESDLAYIFNLPEHFFYKRPFLVKITPIQESTTNALDYIFFSYHHSIDKWQNPEIRESLRTMLNVKSIEDFRYGTTFAFHKGRFRKCEDYRIVILSVVPNDGAPSREVTNDPLFK